MTRGHYGAEVRQGWGLKEWSLLVSMVAGALLILATLAGWIRGGRGAVDHYVDGRAGTVARQVVGDSLQSHRTHEHRQGRR